MNIVLAGSAITYTPNDDQLTRVSIELAAFDGEVGNGLLPVQDSAAALTIATGRQARVEEAGIVLTDGFILDRDRARGPEPAGTAREYSFAVVDANALLAGFRNEKTRSAETDVARVLHWAASYGPTWLTTWVLNSNTVTLPAKKYDTDGGFDELITDCVEFTGKTLFLHDTITGQRCLHYHLLTTGHTSGLTISDVPSAVDGITVFAPQQPVWTGTSVDLTNDVKGRDQSGRTSIVTDAASITAHNVDGLNHQSLIDFEADSQSDLNVKTAAFLASQKDDLDTWTTSIGPLDVGALEKVRPGDLITVTSSVMGLTAAAKRISHMTLAPYAGDGPPAPGLWNATLELGAPIRRRARIKPSLAGFVADPTTPPPASLPFTPGAGTSTLVAVGSSSQISVSQDGITWTVQTSSFSSTILRVAWSASLGLFVAVGSDLGTSPDGVTWTLRTSSFGADLPRGVAWSPALGLFVAVGDHGKIATSSDGISWTQQTSPFASGSTDWLNGVCWSTALGLFVAVGRTSAGPPEIGTSPNGSTWTLRTRPTGGGTGNYELLNVAWTTGLSLFVAVGGGGKVITSPDGTTWTMRLSDADPALGPVGILSGDTRAVAWSPTLALVVVAGPLGDMATSPDGITWTARTSSFGTSTIHDIVWSPGLALFVAVGSGSPAKVATSPDGITWTQRTSGWGGGGAIQGIAVATMQPLPGQTVREIVGTGNGTTVVYSTTYPYRAGSLQMFANGYPEYLVAETNPGAGVVTFDSAPFTPEQVRAEYQR